MTDEGMTDDGMREDGMREDGMTDDGMSPGPPHLDDETLSAVLDGEADEADRDHVARCAACRERLDRFDTVRTAVGAPVVTDTSRVDASVEAALSAWDTSAVVPINGARRRWHAPPAAWVGVAAVVLALLAAVPLVFLGGGGDDDLAATSAETSGKLAERQAESRALRGGSASASSQAAPAAPAGFGAHDDTATLISVLATEADSGAYGATAHAVTDEQADGPARAETPCVEEGRDVAAGRARDLVTTGPVVWRGEDAVVVVFALDGQRRQLYVMALGGCDVLAEQRY